MATGTGTSTIDFGSFPGTNEASVAVTGQTLIDATSKVEAYFMRETSSDHTVGDHTYAPLFITLTCGNIVDATSFTIYGRSLQKMQGTWTVRWIWVN